MNDRAAELRAVIAAFWGPDETKRPTVARYVAALNELDAITGVTAERVRRRVQRG